MSIPGWDEQSPFGRQRGPNGLVIGPDTGQMNPDEEVPTAPVVAGTPLDLASAAWMRASSAALWACRIAASWTKTCSFTLIECSVSRFAARASASCSCVEISCCVTACCCDAWPRTMAVSAAA